jgi:predicted RNA-binding Zn ribbon-like protein
VQAGLQVGPDAVAKPAPMPLLLVQAFVNTRDAEKGVDLLERPDSTRTWLVGAGLLGEGANLSEADLQQVKEVRESLRDLLIRDHGSPDVDALRRLADSGSAHLTIADDGRVDVVSPHRAEIIDGLFQLLLIVRRAQEDGTWSRLRVCANDECRWAFYDRSRNQHGSWCDMATCGNRLKNRELRARRRR